MSPRSSHIRVQSQRGNYKQWGERASNAPLSNGAGGGSDTLWKKVLVYSDRVALQVLRVPPKLLFYIKHKSLFPKKKPTVRNCDCNRAWFGPAPHVRGAYTHAVPAVVRLCPYPRCEMSAPPLDPARKKTVSKVLVETGLSFFAGSKGGCSSHSGVMGSSEQPLARHGHGRP